MRWRGLMAYLASSTPSCSLVCSRVFGCFPPHPTTCCVTITHLSVSRQRPTASPAASHHRGAASHHRGSPHQHARRPHASNETTQSQASTPAHNLEHPKAHPSTTKVVHQQATRRPRRRPAHPPTPSNTLEHADSPHHRHQRRPSPRPTPRTAAPPISSNTRMPSSIDTHHGHTATTSRQRSDHPTTSPITVAKDTPAKPDG